MEAPLTDKQKTYNKIYKEVEVAIKRFQRNLLYHKKKSDERPDNWGYVADIESVLKALKEIQ